MLRDFALRRHPMSLGATPLSRLAIARQVLAALATLAAASVGACSVEFIDHQSTPGRDARGEAFDAARLIDASGAVDATPMLDAATLSCGDGVVERDQGEECDPPSSSCGPSCRWLLTAQVPTMTSASLPAGLVECSGALGTDYDAWQAFDASNTSMWISAEFEPAWISYRWDDGPRVVTQYVIDFVNGTLTSRAPRDFSLQGWDGATWTIIDSRTDETNWNGSERRTYTVQFPGAYDAYRLYVTDDNDERAGVVVTSMGRLQFLGHPISSASRPAER